MPQKITAAPLRTTPTRAAGPGKLEVAQALLPHFQAALDDDNGFKPMSAPPAEALKGAVKFELPMVMSGGSATLYATKKGELLVKNHAKGHADEWSQVNPALIKKSFASLLQLKRVEVSKPANADRYPAFDVSPGSTNPAVRLRTIKNTSFLSVTNERGAEVWYRLTAKTPDPTWKPQ